MKPEKFTTDDLRRWIDDFPVKLSDNKVIHDLWPLSARGYALRRVGEIVYSYSVQKNENFAQTEDRLVDARSLVLNLLSAVLRQSATPDESDKHESLFPPWFSKPDWLREDIWYHRNDLLEEFLSKGYAEDEHFEFRMRYIASFAAALIERPWLDSHFIEWVIVDSLASDGVRQFGSSILESQSAGLRDLWAAVFGKGTVRRVKGRDLERARVVRLMIRILLLFAIPVAGILYGAQSANAGVFFGSAAIGAAYLFWSAYVTIRAEIMQLLGRQPPQTALQQKLKLFLLMHDAYRTLEGPVVDPNRVRTALDAAAEKGAVWNGAIYAVLNRVIARDPTAWVTDDSHSYRAQDDLSLQAQQA